MIKTSVVLAALGLAVATSSAAAQQRLVLELRGGVDIPTAEIEGEELGTGFGFDATLRYRFTPYLALYGGWDWIHFGPDASFAGADLDFEETGYVFGLRLERDFTADQRLGGWVRAGGTYDHIEIESDDGDIEADSGHGLGWEAAAGVSFPLTPSLSMTPGVRYRALDREIELDGTTTDVELRYVALELGLAYGF